MPKAIGNTHWAPNIRKAILLFAVFAVLFLPATVLAWPLESEWIALTKATNAMYDPTGDSQGGNNDPRDIVGSSAPVAGACTAASCPTAYLFNDGTYIYFRLRLNADPRQGGALSPFGWGLLIDSNGVLTDYEWMIMVNGINNPDQIEIDRNVIQGAIDDPSDKAEVVGWSENAVENTNYRVTLADSTFLSNADYFLDFRFPYATFKGVTGLTDSSPIRLFVGSSNNAQVLTADLGDPSNACTVSNNCTISGGIGDTVLPLGTQPTTGSVMFVSDLTGSGDVITAYQGQTLYIKVTDGDRNTSSATLQTVTVTVTTAGLDSETVLLTETGVNTGIFTGSIATAGGVVAPGNSTLQVDPIETVTAVYLDAIDASLNTNQQRTDALVMLRSADLAITKAASNTTPSEGDTVIFTLTVTNNGPNAATGIQVLDEIPAELKYENDNGLGSYNKNTGIWELPLLGVGSSATLVITTSVKNGTNGTTITNTAAISASSLPDPVSGNNAASRAITVGGADLAITKTVSNAAPATGNSITYTVEVLNNGANNATGVQVTDLLPAGVSYSSHVVTQGTYTAASGIWTVGALATGVTSTLSITASVTAAAGSTVTNTATVTASDQADGNTANNSGSVSIYIGGADIALAKTVSNASPNEGAAISYQVTVTNGGPGSPAGVQVTDLLPAGLTFTSAVASQGTYTSTTGLWTVGALATSATLTINATVNAGTNGQIITNTASVTASSVGDPVSANNSASAALTVQRAEVAITKTVSNTSPNLNAAIFYTVTARNNGTNAATNLQVTDVLPALVTYTSYTVSPPGSTYTSGTGLWNIGTLASGATVTLRINVTVSNNNNDALKTVINTATKTAADQADPVGANNSATASFTIQGCDLVVTKSVNNSTPASGSNVVFTITIRNNGPFTTDKNVIVYDVLPAGLTRVSDAETAGSYTPASGEWDFGNQTIASGVTYTMTLTATVTAPTGSAIINSANNAALYDFDLSNNLATAAVLVGGTDIAIAKSVNNATPNVGSTITYTVSARNNGPNAAANLVVSDLLASGLTYTSSVADQGTYTAGTGIWNVGALASGATTTLTISAVINSGTGGSTIVNTASFQSMSAQDTNNANNTASASVTVQAADLYVTKTASNLTPNENDPVVYTVTVTNNGPNSATNVIARDLLASGLTYSSHVVSQGTYTAATGFWAIGTIAKSETKTLQITVKPNIGTGGTNVLNTAAITSVDQVDTDMANNSATITITPVAIPFPNLLIVKSSTVYSDPINGMSGPKSIPGAVIEYTVVVTNSGPGAADNNSTALTDAVPANMNMYVDTGSGDPVTFSCSAGCGLTFNYGSNVKYTKTFPLPALLAPPNVCGNFTDTPSGSFDASIRGVCVNPAGVFNGTPASQFTIKYRMRID